LLDAKRQAALVRLNREHDSLHPITLFQDFGRMLHALGPTEVADVNQAINAVFDLDESAEVGQVAERGLRPLFQPETSHAANPTDWDANWRMRGRYGVRSDLR